MSTVVARETLVSATVAAVRRPQTSLLAAVLQGPAAAGLLHHTLVANVVAMTATVAMGTGSGGEVGLVPGPFLGLVQLLLSDEPSPERVQAGGDIQLPGALAGHRGNRLYRGYHGDVYGCAGVVGVPHGGVKGPGVCQVLRLGQEGGAGDRLVHTDGTHVAKAQALSSLIDRSRPLGNGVFGAGHGWVDVSV